jgi:hypothetical protein
MKSNNSKGQGIVLVFVAITMISLIAGLAAYVQVTKLPPEFQTRVDDMHIVTEAETRLDDTINNFIPVAAHYGVAQAAHHWGDEKNFIYIGQGDHQESDDDTDEMNKYENLIQNVDTQSQYYYESYANTLEYERCEVDTGDSKVNLSFESQLINITADSGDSLASIECQTPDIDVESSSEPGGQIRENMTNIRFHELAQGLIKAMNETEHVAETIERNDNFYGSHTDNATCIYNEDGYSNPEDKAKDAAYDNVISSIMSNKISEIEKALVKRGHGIGSGGRRGAKQALHEYTHGGDLCVFGVCLSEAFMDDISSRNTEVVDNETTFVKVSENSYQCGCAEWVCDQDDDSEYTYDEAEYVDGGQCEHADESSVGNNPYSPDCNNQEDGDASDGNCNINDYSASQPSPECSHEDADFSDGNDCSQDDYSGSTPSPECPSGYSWNGTHCTDGSGSTTEKDHCDSDPDGDGDTDFTYDSGSDSCTWDDGSFGSPSCDSDPDGDGDTDFSYDSSSESCEWADDSFGSATCDEEDFEHDGSGNCVIAEEDLGSTDRPSPQCDDKVYNADVEVDWYYNETLIRMELFDDKFKIPTDNGWQHLALHRRYRREFVANP